MPDALLGDDQLVGEWDADAGLLTVTGWVAGPAGSAAVPLAGAELDVDVAAPARTCQLLVPVAGGGDAATVPAATRAALHRLLGDPRAVALLNLLRGHRGRPVVLPARQEGSAAATANGQLAGLPSPGGMAGVDPRLARLGLALLAATDQGLRPAVRAVAHLEAAVVAADLPAEVALAWGADHTAGTGGQPLLGLAPGRPADPDAIAAALGRLDPVPAFRLAALLRRAANLPGTEPATAETLGRLAARLDLPPFPEAPTSLPATAPAATDLTPEPRGVLAGDAAKRAAEPLDRAAREDAGGAPAPALDAASASAVLSGGARPAISRTSEHEIEVTVPGSGHAVEGLWARVLRPADGVLLALAPFQAAGPGEPDARARLLIPDVASGELLVDLTTDPALPARSAARRAFESALAAGRRAARAQRLGQRGTAVAAWRTCAEAWTAAGDDRRAAMAAEYAELVLVEAVPPTTEPLLSDRLA